MYMLPIAWCVLFMTLYRLRCSRKFILGSATRAVILMVALKSILIPSTRYEWDAYFMEMTVLANLLFSLVF